MLDLVEGDGLSGGAVACVRGALELTRGCDSIRGRVTVAAFDREGKEKRGDAALCRWIVGRWGPAGSRNVRCGAAIVSRRKVSTDLCREVSSRWRSAHDWTRSRSPPPRRACAATGMATRTTEADPSTMHALRNHWTAPHPRWPAMALLLDHRCEDLWNDHPIVQPQTQPIPASQIRAVRDAGRQALEPAIPNNFGYNGLRRSILLKPPGDYVRIV